MKLNATAFFLIAASPLFFSRGVENCFGLPKLLVTVLAVAIMFPAIFTQSSLRQLKLQAGNGRWLLWLSLFVLTAIALSLIHGTTPAWQPLGGIFLYATVFLFAVLSPVSSNLRRSIAGILVAVAELQALLGTLQWQGFDPFFGHATRLFENMELTKRIIGTIGYHNTLGHYLALILPVCLYLMTTSRKNTEKVLWSLAGITIFIAVLLTRSRAAWLAFFVSLTVYFGILIAKGFKPKRGRLVLSLISLGAVIVVLTVVTSHDGSLSISKRFESAFDKQSLSLRQRLLIWKTTGEMIEEKPFLGHGLGSFRLKYLDYAGNVLSDPKNEDLRDAAINVKESHNDYLQIWAELGFIGLSLWLVFLGSSGYCIIKHALDSQQTREDLFWKAAIFGSLTAFLSIGLLSFPLHVFPVAPIFWLLLGLGLNSSTEFEDSANENKSANCWWFNAIRAILLIAAISFAACLYRSDWLFLAGRKASEQGDPRAAKDAFSKAVRLNPWNGRLRFYYGSSLLALGESEKALQEFRKSSMTFSDINLWRNTAKALLDSGDIDRAINILRKTEKTHLYPSAVKSQLAYTLSVAGNYSEALAILESLPEDSQERAEGTGNIARKLIDEGRALKAIDALRGYVATKEEVATESDKRWFSGGGPDFRPTKLSCSEGKLAVDKTLKAIILPDCGNMRIIAVTLLNSDLKHVKLKLEPFYTCRGIAFEDESIPAEDSFDGRGYTFPAESITKYGEPPVGNNAIDTLWRIELQKGRDNVVKADLQRISVPEDHYIKMLILCAAVDSPLPRRNIVKLIYSDGTGVIPLKLSDWCKPVSDEYLQSRKSVVEALDLLGLAWMINGHPSIAEQQLRCARQLDDDCISVLNNLAAAHRLQGRLREALSLWRQVLQLDSDNPTALKNIYRHKGLPERVSH